jgi:hypothetical protein
MREDRSLVWIHVRVISIYFCLVEPGLFGWFFKISIEYKAVVMAFPKIKCEGLVKATSFYNSAYDRRKTGLATSTETYK